MGGPALSRPIVDPREARLKLRSQCLLLAEALPLAGYDLRGRALGELGPRQLAFEELDGLGSAFDFLLETLALAGEVDDPGQIDVELGAVDDRHRRIPRPSRSWVDD